ncbi:MAG: efflux RND transporter periplasmic adaptor subunit, partial [Hymenobacter sp.]
MRRIFLFLSLGAVTCFASCSEKKEEKEEQIKLLVTSPLAIDTTIT